MDVEPTTSLPPPVTTTPSTTPNLPQAGSNTIPHRAGTAPTPYVAPPVQRATRSRTRVYTIGTIVFVVLSIGGYIGFREYIYGDDAPPVPVLDDLAD